MVILGSGAWNLRLEDTSMTEDPFWSHVDQILEGHEPYREHLPDPAKVEATREAEGAAYMENLGTFREVLEPWVEQLRQREFQISLHKATETGLSVKYHRRGYQGTGGFGSWHDAYGNLIAAWIAPRSDPRSLSLHTDPDENTHLGQRFSREAFQTFLQNNLLTYLDESNLLHDHLSWHKWRKDYLSDLRQQFDKLKALTDRQAAGREFEKLLDRLFTLAGLAPRGSFRVVGEQIDGSFLLDHETYLVEAKWEKDALDNKELYAFKVKIEGKSPYTRGTFIAVNGITKDAEAALLKGKEQLFFVVVGVEIQRVLDGEANLVELLRRRRELLAEEGAVLNHRGADA
jgi:hypothetical protein